MDPDANDANDTNDPKTSDPTTDANTAIQDVNKQIHNSQRFINFS